MMMPDLEGQSSLESLDALRERRLMDASERSSQRLSIQEAIDAAELEALSREVVLPAEILFKRFL